MPRLQHTTRFAPSPTGLLHLGHAWSAVLAHDLARAGGGRFLLRIEDIDTGRCRPGFTQALIEDLRWLGLGFDAPPLLQSTRREAHAAALARLAGMGLTYPCFCTRADIAQASSAPHGMPPVYPGTCRALPAEEAGRRMQREPHAIRLDVEKALALSGPLSWQDALAGGVEADPAAGGDIVLARRDIGVGYMLAAVVDDGFQGISRIVRGRDLFEATHVQRLLQHLLGLEPPQYLHHALLLAEDGRRLAKRDKAETLASLRAGGMDGKALADRLRAEPPEGPDRHLPKPEVHAGNMHV